MLTKLRHTNNGSFSPAEHMEFVKNKKRNRAFDRAFARLAAGKTVLDVGTGSGLLALYATRAGAKKVIAIEKDKRMAEIAHHNFRRSKFSDIIELRMGDALDLTPHDLPPVDLIVGELLSTWCVIEPQVPVMKHLLTILERNPQTIPRRIINQVEGVYARFGDVEGLVEIPTVYFEFDGKEKARSLTEVTKASKISFSADMSLQADLSVTLSATNSGTINALRLTSITETCEGTEFGSTDDTMPKMIVPLPEPIEVQPGQSVSLSIRYEYGKGWENFSVSARKADK